MEIYNPLGERFLAAAGRMDAARFFSTATRLPDGAVLIAGGYDSTIASTDATRLFIPAS